MSKKILIVEDTRDIAEALSELLRMRGFLPIVASGGFEGIRLAREETPDLILMDVAMPDLDGISAVKEIRTMPGTALTPILAVTSYAEGYRAELIEAGCNEVFSKSSFISSFAPTLRRYLGE